MSVRVRVKWPGKLHEELKVVLCQSFRYTFYIAPDDVRAIRQRSFDTLGKRYTDGKSLENDSYPISGDTNFIANKNFIISI